MQSISVLSCLPRLSFFIVSIAKSFVIVLPHGEYCSKLLFLYFSSENLCGNTGRSSPLNVFSYLLSSEVLSVYSFIGSRVFQSLLRYSSGRSLLLKFFVHSGRSFI